LLMPGKKWGFCLSTHRQAGFRFLSTCAGDHRAVQSWSYDWARATCQNVPPPQGVKLILDKIAVAPRN
jgi:hypothetical protein